MKKITLTLLLSFIFSIGFSQSPEYNYSIELVGTSGITETYEVVITASEASPPGLEVNEFQAAIGWDAGAYNNALLVDQGTTFGSFSEYFLPGVGVITADLVNSITPTPVSVKDILSITSLAVISGGHPAGNFQMIRFSVDRVMVGAAAPVILDNADVDLAKINGVLSAGVVNEFFADEDGSGTAFASTDKFNPNLPVLSNDRFDFNALDFATYPNPTKGTLFVQNPSDRDFDYEVISIAGRVVIPNGTLVSRSENKIELGGLNDGVYFLNVKSGSDDKKSIKIILN
jgi:hypothetical protein